MSLLQYAEMLSKEIFNQKRKRSNKHTVPTSISIDIDNTFIREHESVVRRINVYRPAHDCK